MPRKILSLTLILSLLLSVLALGIQAVPVIAAVEMELDPVNGNVGEQVEVSFTNWDPESDISYNLFFGTIKVLSGITDNSKNHFTVPKSGAGDYKVTLRSGSATILSTATFKIEPKITLNPKTAQVGDKITISGTGFQANKSATVYFNNAEITDYEVDAYGSFSTPFTVPEVAFGPNSFTVRDANNSADGTLSIIPKIVPSSTTTAVGDKITLSGTGFSGSSKVSIYLDDANTNTTAATNPVGTFTEKQLAIPVISAGTHVLTVKDASDHSASITLNTSQSITLNPRSGPGGTEITITGGGFTPNKTVSIKYKGIDIATTPASISSDSNGSFTAVVKAPGYASGAYSIIVTQGTLIADASFTQTSTANVDRTSGPIGSTVTASGSGFNANAKITIKYDGTDLLTSNADTGGLFSASFKIPAGQPGQHKIVITDSINSFPSIFTATPAASLDTATGNTGSDINVSGNAFTPGSTIKIKFDSIDSASTAADSSGAFSTGIKIPVGKGGPHNITISDGTTSTTLVFNIETNPPPAPVLTLPAVGEKSDPLTQFKWNSVTDPSGPVTYTLQIARDASFITLFFEKSGLTTNNYSLAEPQRLKNSEAGKPYYWRVKAIDAASNESAWSLTRYFSVGTSLPGWIWIVIFVVGGLLLITAGFYVGKKWSGGFEIPGFVRQIPDFFRRFKRR
jgi:hypothetical protein